jgi:hypothetical protein
MNTRQIAPRKQNRKRLEFDKKTKIEMFKRAGGPEDLRCEGTGCGIPLRGKPFEYDHTLECWEMEDIEHGLRPPLTAEDGKLLCIPCHQEKTGRKAGERAHGKRIVAKAARAETKKRSSFRTNRDSPYKVKMDGTVVWRETGEPVK